jgi:protein tyrosine/serine phosphatase
MRRLLIPSLYRGELATSRGRRSAWLDSLLVDHALLRMVWTNFGVVVPGRLYRANHPTPGGLARLVRRHGIRTVINLRGASGNGSDALSREAALRLGVAFVDATLSSGQPPSRERVLALIAAFDGAMEPILVHCKSGADRAGFAAGVFRLLQGGGSGEALAQLSWRFGHLRRSRAGILDAFFLAYRREAEGRRDFRDWVRAGYDPASLRRDAPGGRIAAFVQDRVLARE